MWQGIHVATSKNYNSENTSRRYEPCNTTSATHNANGPDGIAVLVLKHYLDAYSSAHRPPVPAWASKHMTDVGRWVWNFLIGRLQAV